jgi:hypothetical protein
LIQIVPALATASTAQACPPAPGVPAPIAIDDSQPTYERQERAGLAKLLTDQFAVLDDTRPTGSRAIEDGDVVIFAFSWPLNGADEVLVSSGRDEQLSIFRSEFLRIITPSLSGLVELDLRREVTSSLPVLGDDPRDVTITFALGIRKGQDPEATEALKNWSRQLRRKARGERLRLRSRREELRLLREQIPHGGDER